MSQKLQHEYIFRHIKLTLHLKKPYSEYGCYLNMCVVHQTYYKWKSKVIGGIILGLEEKGGEQKSEHHPS